MHIKSLHVKNFRALEDITLNFDPEKRVNVIVGPNAIGKTTILEAIRLPKALLALILTFLLIGRSVANNGIILLDEPELHLNPAVCKTILPFLVDRYCAPKNLQAMICTHSAEIVAGAFGRDDCALYHLVSEKIISVVSRKDRDEIADALSRLGTSEGEELLYKGTVFVEGDHDVELLEEGFGDIIGRYSIKDLGGETRGGKANRNCLAS